MSTGHQDYVVECPLVRIFVGLSPKTIFKWIISLRWSICMPTFVKISTRYRDVEKSRRGIEESVI